MRHDFVVQINITTMFETPSQRFVESSEWELVRTQNVVHRAYYACCEEPYIDLEFRMQLRRRPTFASHLFVAPSIILCLVTPTVFALPPASFEKLTLGKSYTPFTRYNRFDNSDNH